MPPILALARLATPDGQWMLAASPEGLFRVEAERFAPLAQPQTHLYCCAANGRRLFVGGLPHGIAYSDDAGASWQASWMAGIEAPAVCIAPAPGNIGVLLAGTEGGGVLRSIDNGASWMVCNLGLRSFNVLALAWAPPAPPEIFPAWETVFAATDEGVYRSPNGGRGWRRCAGADGLFQALAVSRQWQQDSIVIAGTETSGLFYSCDQGHHFAPVTAAPQQVDALVAVEQGWLLANDSGLWYSDDARCWAQIDDATPALVMLVDDAAVVAGGAFGLKSFDTEAVATRFRHARW